MRMKRLFVTALLLIAATCCSAALAGAVSLNVSGTENPSAYLVYFADYVETVNDPNPGLITPIAVDQQSLAGPWIKGAWITYNNPDQSWPMGSKSGNLPGRYYYNTMFDLGSLDPATAVIKGSWASDNSGVLVFNGQVISTVASEIYRTLTDFTITDGFLPGENFLTFEVTNDPLGPGAGINPTGLLVNIYEASASAVPEPATILLLAGGLAGVCLMRRRER